MKKKWMLKIFINWQCNTNINCAFGRKSYNLAEDLSEVRRKPRTGRQRMWWWGDHLLVQMKTQPYDLQTQEPKRPDPEPLLEQDSQEWMYISTPSHSWFQLT